jgi:hypothetical protein
MESKLCQIFTEVTYEIAFDSRSLSATLWKTADKFEFCEGLPIHIGENWQDSQKPAEQPVAVIIRYIAR